MLTAQVTKVLIHRFHGEAPTVEQIRDVAEQTLIAANHLATARAYIVYREQHATLRADRQTLVDVESSINEYLTRADWRVNANANQGYSLGGLILNVAGKVTANYWLSHVYTPEIGEAHRNGDIHIHDLDMLSGYCAGWSLRTLLHEGLNGVPGKVEAGPPKHMSSAVGQIVNFLGTLQTSGRARRRSRRSTPTWRRLCARCHGLRRRCASAFRSWSTTSTCPLALGHADAVHQPHLRLDLPRRPARAGAGDRWRRNALRLWRFADREMDLISLRLHRRDDHGRCQGRAFTFPSHVQHH